MTGRSRKILFSLVAEYIASGAPVGSRTLSRKYGLKVSPATIRTVLADLEEAGLVFQPHTSAGRVPTERGLREFIEALNDLAVVPPQLQRRIVKRTSEIYQSPHQPGRDSLRLTGQLLSELSGAAAVVTQSSVDARKLAQLRFINTKPNQLLAVLVFKDGMVENRYVTIDGPITDRDLDRMHNLLADVVEGRTLAVLRDLIRRRLEDSRTQLDKLRWHAFELARRALHDPTGTLGDVVIEGRSSLLELPEYTDIERLKKLILALDDGRNLLDLLNKTMTAGVVTVYIGNETEELGDAELSLVVAPYSDGDHNAGTVGILGPTRMDYPWMMSLVTTTADAISAVMKKTKL